MHNEGDSVYFAVELQTSLSQRRFNSGSGLFHPCQTTLIKKTLTSLFCRNLEQALH